MSGSMNQSKTNAGNSIGSDEKKPERQVDIEAKAKNLVETPLETIKTLGEKFKSLVGIPINIKDRNPEYLITLIGHALGVDDYETNIASFWFLDFIALQVLIFENDLDDNGKSVLISWLAGEMQLIREKKLSHDAFWRRVKEIFDKCSTKRQSLPHWDLIIQDNNLNEIIMEEDNKDLKRVSEISQKNFTKNRAGSKSQRKIMTNQSRSRQSGRSLQKLKTDKIENLDNVISMPKVDVLDAVKEATYNMYGDIFHYTLIVAAFVDPVPIYDYKLPFTFRVPRPIKTFNPENSKNAVIPITQRGSKEMKKQRDAKKISNSRDTKTTDVISEPVIITDDEILMEKRRFILPLMEANEAADVLKDYKQMQTK